MEREVFREIKRNNKYNVFTEEEWKESRAAVVQFADNSAINWHIGRSAFESLSMFRGMRFGTYLCGKGELNEVADDLSENGINVQYKSLPELPAERTEDIMKAFFKDVTDPENGWKILSDEIQKLRNV